MNSFSPSAKKIPHWRIIWAKGQFDHSYTFLTMPILIFSPGANFGHHPLVRISFEKVITFGGYVRMGPWELDTHKFEVLKCVASNNLLSNEVKSQEDQT